jgi:23S rRNA (adenine-N6)-dimethyltransferase
VERDPKLAAQLRQRFRDQPQVRVVEADLRMIALPRRNFLVVASPPFSLTSAICRRLLGDPAVPLAGAELIMQREVARWLTSPRPRDAETAWWTARYHVCLTQPVSSASFSPPPSVSAAWLSVRPRRVTVSARGQRCLRAILRTAYRRPGARIDSALAGHKRTLWRAGLDPAAQVADVTADQWHRLAILLDAGTIRAR